MRASSINFVLALAAASMAQTQTNGPTVIQAASPPQSTTLAPSSLTTSSTSASSSVDVPLSLWAVAESLISSNYPSSSISNVASLTWPATVVIGSSTYSVHSAPTGSPSSSLTGNSPVQTNSSPASNSNRNLAIIIGVVVGVAVLAIAGGVFFCLHRRKKNREGGFVNRRSHNSVSDSEIGRWRQPSESMLGSGTTVSHSREWLEKYSRIAAPAPPMTTHPAFTRNQTSESISEDNPFFTPAERRSEAQLEHAELAPEGSTPPGSSGRGETSVDRPPTPFSPMAMLAGANRHHSDESSVSRDYSSLERGRPVNPFASDEDRAADEADDVVPPFIPVKSPERRHSPQVHYPSWSELSEFDFAGDGQPRRAYGHRVSADDLSSRSSPSTQGFMRRESVVGRHELAGS